MSADTDGAAAERLEASRERLRRAMSRTGKHPGVQLGVDGLSAWWEHSPLRTAAQVAAESADGWARPVAQRHPLRLVGGALLAGGLFSALRPWRWLPQRALWAALGPPLLARALASVKKA